MEGLNDMLKGYGLQPQDFEAGGKYHDEFQTSMAIAALRCSRDAKLFCAATAAVFANSSTANVLELQK